VIAYDDLAQRSDEWRALRAGKLTGSVAADILATLKTGKEPACRRDLRVRLVAERLTGQPQENAFVSEAMQRGIDKEADALAAYETQTGRLVMPVGFIAHDTLAAGCSPDGLVSHDGLIEAKCPKTATHLGYVDDPASLLAEYHAQIIHNLWITQRSWADIVSFDDRLPEHLRLVIVRYDAHTAEHTKEIASYELAARQFLREVDAAVERYAVAKVA
jgi:hypothetical protein